MSLPHVCLYVCLCAHGTAETLDGVEEWPDTQTSQQTDAQVLNQTSMPENWVLSPNVGPVISKM